MHTPTEQREEEEEERLPLSIDHHHSSSSSDDDGEDFEFAFVSDPNADAAVSAADDIFADGKILPIYPSPFFSSNLNKASSKQLRNLFLEEVEEEKNDPSSKSFSSSSSADELEGIPEGTYCVWTPKSSSSALKKSGSTGTSSSSLRVKIRDLVIGRSRSDGKEKLLYFPAAAGESAGGYKKGGGGGGGGSGRKTFLPYRQDILGLFGSGKATGRAHTHRPL